MAFTNKGGSISRPPCLDGLTVAGTWHLFPPSKLGGARAPDGGYRVHDPGRSVAPQAGGGNPPLHPHMLLAAGLNPHEPTLSGPPQASTTRFVVLTLGRP